MGASALIRRFGFSASHSYRVVEWSDEKNRRVFGTTAEPHSHDFVVEIEVVGPPDPLTGFVVDLARLDALLETSVRRPLEGENLNEVIPEVAGGEAQPSTEFLAAWIWRRIAADIAPPAQLARVRVYEDPELAGEYRS